MIESVKLTFEKSVDFVFGGRTQGVHASSSSFLSERREHQVTAQLDKILSLFTSGTTEKEERLHCFGIVHNTVTLSSPLLSQSSLLGSITEDLQEAGLFW